MDVSEKHAVDVFAAAMSPGLSGILSYISRIMCVLSTANEINLQVTELSCS